MSCPHVLRLKAGEWTVAIHWSKLILMVLGWLHRRSTFFIAGKIKTGRGFTSFVLVLYTRIQGTLLYL